MKWEIRYYLTETAHRSGVVAYKETSMVVEIMRLSGLKTSARALNL